ncbi:IS66 family insertion sequence element accessory protein TnpB [Burkholderia pyrrocinia]|uniref:IS66 family insertion sequence element accessory protein TnpB n=1 Tax=Burkholderia pyrrocinia TaxID=60550 RepID=UPI002445ED00|nr:IS66 family insertion sequence element accessory protein TnpB [Burkholderia pyrrocinia]
MSSRASRSARTGRLRVPQSETGSREAVARPAGFWLMLKRLEVDRFAWLRRQQAVIELTVDQLHLLLDGVDIDALCRHPERQYCFTS